MNGNVNMLTIVNEVSDNYNAQQGYHAIVHQIVRTDHLNITLSEKYMTDSAEPS